MTTFLFTLKTAREDVLVGWSAADADAALESLTAALLEQPATLLWRYASTRAYGKAEQAPVSRIAVFRDSLAWITPANSEFPVRDLPATSSPPSSNRSSPPAS